MEKSKSIAIKAIVFMLHFAIFIVDIFLYLNKIIIFEAFLALLFLQGLTCGIMFFVYYQYKRLQNLARSLDFKYLKGSFPHPKYEGHYKNNWWQLHFVSKETGEQWGLPRVYIKMQWKKTKHFNEGYFDKYKNMKYRENNILEVKHVIRDYKNYLLLKRNGFTFNKEKIHELMDLLLKIAAESEIRKK
jgi:hypothetical protein